MDRATQQGRAETFHRLHAGDGVLVLVNAWDAASARLFEVAGVPAIATTSAGMAWSLGYADGEQLSVRRRVGVRRVSLGCGPFQAALALARRIPAEVLGEGEYAAMTTSMLSAREVNGWFVTA